MLDILLRIHETFDREELLSIAEDYAPYDLSHLPTNAVKNCLSQIIGKNIEVQHV